MSPVSALVTGASRGIGLSIASTLVKRGISVILVSSSESGLEQATEHLMTCRSSSHVQVTRFPMDLSTAELSEKIPLLCRQMKANESQLRYFIHAAGISQQKLLLSTKQDDISRIMHVNLTSAILLTRGLLPILLKSTRTTGGSILYVSSVLGNSVGSSGESVYSATKAGLVGLTKSLALELSSKQITVNSLAPGYTSTSMINALSSGAKSSALSRIPLGRFGEIEEMSDAAWFLLNAKYMTGQVLTVDGGLSL